jgi:hypothetical protein
MDHCLLLYILKEKKYLVFKKKAFGEASAIFKLKQ